MAGNPGARFEACAAIEKLIRKYDRPDIEVHLLGCNEGPIIVDAIHKAFPFVRGCDTAFAYMQALTGRKICRDGRGGRRPELAEQVDLVRGADASLIIYLLDFESYVGTEGRDCLEDACAIDILERDRQKNIE